MNQRGTGLSTQLIVVLVACAFLFFFGLGAFGLVGADEPRYAQIAREMLARHDWIVPTLNGNPWLEKPVLLYWKVMNSYAIFGVHDWAARVPAAFHATAMVFVIFFFMRRFRPGSELDAAIISASCAAVIAFGRGASTDMLLSAPVCLALLAWWTWHETGKKLWLAVFYGMLAIGTLAKGPVAPALAVLIVGAYTLARREPKIFLRSVWWPGFLLYFAIALPWFVAVQIKVPQFFREFFLQHNLERFGTNRYQHSQPFWYYIPVFLMATIPWTIFIVSAIVSAVKEGLKRIREKSTGTNADWLPVFLVIWALIPVLFFSVSRSKLPGYVLPGIPAAAMLAADWLHRKEQAVSRALLVPHAILCGLLVFGALFAPWKMLKANPPAPLLASMGVAAVVVALIVLFILRRGLRTLYFATLLPIVLALGFLLKPAAHVLDQVNSARAVDARLTELHVPNIPIAVFYGKRDVQFGLNFYRNAEVTRYEQDGGNGQVVIVAPPEEHLLIARDGELGAIQAILGQRQVKQIGRFTPQHLEFYLVSNAR
jgi:4-amino-4-deoxy-L-arabinose transferase-like glycosyltransferase